VSAISALREQRVGGRWIIGQLAEKPRQYQETRSDQARLRAAESIVKRGEARPGSIQIAGAERPLEFECPVFEKAEECVRLGEGGQLGDSESGWSLEVDRLPRIIAVTERAADTAAAGERRRATARHAMLTQRLAKL